MRFKKAVSFLFILLSLCGALFFAFSQNNAGDNTAADYSKATRLYREAEKLAANDSDPAAEQRSEVLSKQALLLYRGIIAQKTTGSPDAVLFDCFLKAGLLQHFFDSLPQAKSYYVRALALRPALPRLADSFFFQPNLFAGSIYYSNNIFDSALIRYREAELIADKYNVPLAEEERLYNRMGVMQYETGNYRLANNYFQKALAVLPKTNPSYKDLFINYKMNIASVLINLEEYEKADTVFRSILPFHINVNEINHNLGIIQFRLGKPQEALSFLRTVSYPGGAARMSLYLSKAEAFSGLGQKDSSEFYAARAMEENAGHGKNTGMGLLLKFLAEEKMKVGKITAALELYQQAIIQLYPAYNENDLYSAPEKYSGAFAYMQLFQTLVAKADAFGLLYASGKKEKDIKASLAVYRSAFLLADHVAKNYESEEARLFLNKIKYAVHDKALQTALTVYELTGDKKYAEEAYFFDQRNKASVLSMAIQENDLEKKAGLPATLLSQQATIRAAITRLSIRALNSKIAGPDGHISAAIGDKEIALARVQEKLNANPVYAALQPEESIPSVPQLQAMLDKKTVLLSYHLAQKSMITFIVTKNNFTYVKQAIDSSFYKDIRTLVTALHTAGNEERYTGAVPAAALYARLIRPATIHLKGMERLIIIPDDELNAVPFESLQDERGHYLLQSCAIQYQFSTALLKRNDNRHEATQDLIAFAPFAAQGAGRFAALPGSGEEISGLEGKILKDSLAVKSTFMALANQYRTVQLATHASANDSFPERSFIAFSPGPADSNSENILYAREIYGLRLDSTDLVILSACETGTGRLVHGEGLMSLTRGFAYAGCPNIITSLWKANDKTTAYITKRFHYYFAKGYTKDLCLQFAKKDLLADKEISPALKTPDCWSHLILIGSYEPARSSCLYWWIAGVSFLLLIFWVIKKSRKKRDDGFSGK